MPSETQTTQSTDEKVIDVGPINLIDEKVSKKVVAVDLLLAEEKFRNLCSAYLGSIFICSVLFEFNKFVGAGAMLIGCVITSYFLKHSMDKINYLKGKYGI